MKLGLFLLTLILAGSGVQAQTIGVSTLPGTPGGSVTRNSGGAFAQSFTTDGSAAAFDLISITWKLYASGGSNSGFSLTLMANSGSNLPGEVLATLSGPTSLSGYAENVFTATNVTLAANTRYWFSGTFTSGDGDIAYYYTTGGSTGDWTLSDTATSGDGTTWFSQPSGSNTIFSVQATSAIPEPASATALLGVVVLGAVFTRRRPRVA